MDKRNVSLILFSNICRLHQSQKESHGKENLDQHNQKQGDGLLLPMRQLSKDKMNWT